jgi:hypothetical protein
MIRWEVPMKTVSESNGGAKKSVCRNGKTYYKNEHWTDKHKRHKAQQFVITMLFLKENIRINPPCLVTLTRLAPRQLDDDNLRGCLKWVRDEISEQILPEYRNYYINKHGKAQRVAGRADADPRIEWAYKQEKAPKMGIRIEIVSKESA